MKRILLILALLSFLTAKSQFVATNPNTFTYSVCGYETTDSLFFIQDSLSGIIVPWIFTDGSRIGSNASKIYFKHLMPYYTNNGSPVRLVGVNSDGFLGPYNPDSLMVVWNNVKSKPSFATVATTGSYNDLTNKPSIPSGTVTSVGLSSTDLSVSGSPITSSGAITANLTTTGVSAGTYNSSYTVDTKGRITAATNASFNASPGRSLSTTGSNNTFTISASKNARVTYTINFSFALTLVTSNGVVSLDYSVDGGSNWISVASVSNAYTVAVTLTGNADNCLSGEIPANALVRIYRSTATNITVTLTKQQEITY